MKKESSELYEGRNEVAFIDAVIRQSGGKPSEDCWISKDIVKQLRASALYSSLLTKEYFVERGNNFRPTERFFENVKRCYEIS